MQEIMEQFSDSHDLSFTELVLHKLETKVKSNDTISSNFLWKLFDLLPPYLTSRSNKFPNFSVATIASKAGISNK